jgi:hypothetical protein
MHLPSLVSFSVLEMHPLLFLYSSQNSKKLQSYKYLLFEVSQSERTLLTTYVIALPVIRGSFELELDELEHELVKFVGEYVLFDPTL